MALLGPQTVTAEWATDAGKVNATSKVDVLELSGAHWKGRFPNSTALTDLAPTFKTAVDSFFAALSTAGVTPSIN